MNYITKGELEAYTGLQIDNTLDTFLNLITSGAKNYIDLLCSSDELGQRWFDDDDTESTRYFDGNGLNVLYVDDLREVTSIVASITRGNGVSLTEDTDFYLYPLNAPANGFPYEYIELANPAYNLPANSRIQAFAGGMSAYLFYVGQKNIAITGKWGFNAIADGAPPVVKIAMLKICAGIIKENIGDTDLKELTSETLGEYSASYSKVKDIADRLEIADLLEPVIRKRLPMKKTGGMRIAH